MSALPEQAWYLYALRADEQTFDDVDGIVPGASVQTVPADGVFLLASQVARALFDRDHPENRCANPEWMAERVAAHHRVNTAAAAAGASLPLSFGTMFSSLARVKEWLRPRQATMAKALDRVVGHDEWLVALTEVADRHAAWLEAHDPELVVLRGKAAAAGEGLGFLLAQRIQKARGIARAAHLRTAAEEIAQSLRSLAASVLPEARQDGWPAWSILVEQPQTPAQGIAVSLDRLSAALEPRGLTLRLTGPWPAYGFARELCAAEVADV